jgi:tRNA G10  N-methylase Trm11
MQYKSLLILGRQPAIGIAELESMLGADHITPVGEFAVISDIAPDQINFARIGSSIRLAKIIAPLETTAWPAIARKLGEHLADHLNYLPAEGKLKLGISIFGIPLSAQHLFRSGLELKKVCKKAGRSVRLVPNTELALSSATVLHNQLTGEMGWEALLVKDGNKTWLAQTVAVQDITAYARRDQGRPKRDARVGMLPPKLAQTIVNLATGPLVATDEHIVLDPFCGTGVVLQEALLMGYGAYGTDLEPRMIDYSRENLEWLATHGKETTPELEVGDATAHDWAHPFSVVASETYLGRPLSNWPGSDTLREIIGTCNVIIEKFLKNMADQTRPGQRLCLAVPAWHGPGDKIYHLPLIDHLEEIGYNRQRFEHVRDADLVYFRPEQLVARELLVITRK